MADIDWTVTNNPTARLPSSESFLKLCRSVGFNQHVLQRTHGRSILDLVLSSESRAVVDVKVGTPVGFSDHAGVYFTPNMASAQSLRRR